MLYEFECDSCGTITEEWFSAKEIPPLGSRIGPCDCRGSRVRILSRPHFHIHDSEPIFEQVYKTNRDGTITVEPAAKALKRGHRRVIPKSTPLPGGSEDR